MGTDDKVHNAAEDVAGHAKEAAGKATDDPKLEAEGQTTRPRHTSGRLPRTSKTRSQANHS